MGMERAAVGRQGLFIGEVAARSGVSRKALRLYEATGIVPAPARTGAGYRLYGPETLRLLGFVTRARRLGFSLAEVREVVTLQRGGRPPCPHVRDLVRRKLAGVDRALAELTEARASLRAVLRSWPLRAGRPAAVCPHIEGKGGNAP